MKYYRIFCNDDLGAVLLPPDIYGHEIIPDCGWVDSWPFLELVQDSVNWPGPMGDYLNNDLGRLCSSRLKGILESSKSKSDIIQWLPVNIIYDNGQFDEYYILHFPEPLDVLDREKSIIEDEIDVVIKPILSNTLIDDHKLFTLKGLEIATVVDNSMKNALEKEGIIGINYSRIPSY